MQLAGKLETLRDNPPHPGVRMEDGKPVGGTAEELEAQIEWRGQVERLEHEQTAAQADEAWARSGGPDGFTDAEVQKIERLTGKLDEIQERLDDVNGRIDENQARLDEAAGVMASQQKQGGGPSAQSAAAAAVGARLQGDRRVLEKEKTSIQQEQLAARDSLTKIIRTRVRTQLEDSDIEVETPIDRVGKAAVEDAFLRRVFRRLGLPFLPAEARGLLDGLSGAQSRRLGVPGGRYGLVAGVIVVSVALAALIFTLGGDDSTPSTSTEQSVSDSTDSDEAGTDEGGTVVGEEPGVAVDEEEPGVAVDEEEPAVAVDDPVAQLTIVETSVLADPEGGALVEVAFAAPWLPGAPSVGAAWDMFVQVGIAFEGQYHSTTWSLSAGKTRGVGYVYGTDGRATAAIDGEMWVTPEGKLVVKLPGLSPGSGLPVSVLGPDAVVAWNAQLIMEEGGEIQRWDGTSPLGEVTQLSEPLPLSAWQPVETDFGPVTLVIPSS